ncbi:hypothetical protein C0995_014865 [Termitomyces sp. Mi166|nr:hypothetical protein C0995_014865 [Termitomyces sp. Mi166\
MAAPSQPSHVSATGSPRSRHSVHEGPSTSAIPEERYSSIAALHATDRNVSTVDPTVLDSGIAAAQQSPVLGSSRGSKRFSSRLSQLAKRALGKPSIDNPERRAEEGRPLDSARGISPAALSPAESSSQSIYDTFEGTTAVGHDNYEPLPVVQTIGSPVYIEPKPTKDYAKMEKSRVSIVSFNSYVHRVKQFLRELNDLPWVAERVTVDYIPGESKGRRQARVPRLQRPLSWYGNTPHTRRPSLFSDSTSPTSQLPQVQLPAQDQFAALQFPPLDRSLPAQQSPPAQQELPRAPTLQQEVLWEIIDPNNPSDVPYATVVPANWSIHHPVPPNPPQPTMPTQEPQPRPHPPPEPQPVANPPSTILQQPDGYQRFASFGETYPTGYVPPELVESIEAAAEYQDRRIHPRSQDLPPQNPAPQQSGPTSTSTTTSATQEGQDGFRAGAPQTVRGLEEPFTTSLGGANNSLPASSAPTPYNPTQPPVVTPIPRVASGSAVPTPPANVQPIPRVTIASFASPGRPPSAAPSRGSRTSQHSRGAASVQSENRPPSAARSHASRAPSHLSRASSASAGPAMSQTPNRPPSVALGHASRAPSARASQSRPPSVAPSHVSRVPSAASGAHTPRPIQHPQPVSPPAA